ncbi:MAG TPA: four-carbon acid sugar kinase family protein [Intrasporangium sp.]|uniref:four-carbon acid sugar kinase family protein n=1 Tax=Intrasporangium sp. TaxID=1925024 RepID=UPI002D786DD3|nr:four-carbon acid sugar kinase family protein [Intrasporangium sp.]HET7397852.1 four-carbon acid sugar kinase family protein [Intrasporangium sp.]
MGRLELAIVADDLSGAAECASVAALRVSRSTVLLQRADRAVGGPVVDARVVTIDTDSRQGAPGAAAAAARRAARVVHTAPTVVKKVDSLLRGNVAAEVAAVAEELGRVAVVAVSNPASRRVVRDGVLRVDGAPLHESGLWHVEGRMPPRSVAEALAPLRAVLVGHEVVDRGPAAIAEAMASVTDAHAVLVCDAESDAHLDAVAEAAASVWAEPLLVGSAALVAAAVRALALRADGDPARTASMVDESPARTPTVPALLVALGTRAPLVSTQLDRLRGGAAYVELLSPPELLTDQRRVADRLAGIPREGLVVVALDPHAPADPGVSRRLTAAFAEVVAPVAAEFPGVFLSGGETARAVLDRTGVEALTVEAELEPGTVVSSTTAGQLVVTRPGSYGDADSLVRATSHLLRHPATIKEHS